MTIKITVKGKVQGVFFRDTSKEVADSMNIRGTVENLSNGDVEILAQGKKKALKQFLKWCEEGPESAQVAEVSTEEIPNSNFLKNYIVKRWWANGIKFRLNTSNQNWVKLSKHKNLTQSITLFHCLFFVRTRRSHLYFAR